MPILSLDSTSLVQICAKCGNRNTIPLKQGYAKAKKGPYQLAPGDDLEFDVDGQGRPPFAFTPGHLGGSATASAAQVASALSAVAGVTVDVDHGAVRLVTTASGPSVKGVQVKGGKALARLGFDGRIYGPRMLGVSKGEGAGKQTAPDIIELPHCPECDAKECLQRTWDTCPERYQDSFFGRHRRIVNALAQHLKDGGFSHPEAAGLHGKETRAPVDLEPGVPATPVTLPEYVVRPF